MPDRRFGTGMRGSDVATQPGLVMQDDNQVYLVAPDGTRSLLSSLGGGGPFSGVVLEKNVFDVRTEGEHRIPFGTAYDNAWDFNVIPEIPEDLGLEFGLDGVATDFTTLEEGIWTFTLRVAESSGEDATFVGYIIQPVVFAVAYLHVPRPAELETAVFGAGISISGEMKLPAAATFAFAVVTDIAATSNPYNVSTQLHLNRRH